MRFANLFFKEGALAEANAAYKDRIAEIEEEKQEKSALIAGTNAAAKQAFRDRLAANKKKRDEKFAAISAASTIEEAVAAWRE